MARYWILKTDADAYPFDRLEREGRTTWDGVTKSLALKHIGSMAPGDRVLIYHSNVGKELVGLTRVATAPYPDPEAGDSRRLVVDVEVERRLPHPVPLSAVKADPALAELGLVRMPRLSVVPVRPEQWRRLLTLTGVR